MANFNTCKAVFIAKHNTGNKNAATKKDFEDAGLNGYFDEYVQRFTALHKACGDILTATQDLSKTDQSFQALERKAFTAWKDVLEMAQPSVKTALIPTRRVDLRMVLGNIKKAMVVDGVSVYGKTGVTAFRRVVETYVGCLMAAQYVLTDEESETVKSYQKALKTINKATSKITDLGDIKDRYVGDINKIKKLKGAESTIETLQKLVDDIDKEIKDWTDKKTEAEKVVEDKKAGYTAIQLKVKKAEITDEQVKAKEVA